MFQQQPIDRIPRYLVPRKHGRALPPLLHYGWIIDLKRTFKLAEDQDLAFYHYMDGPKKPDYFTTCSTFIPTLMHDLGLPYDERVYLCQIGSGELNPSGTVAVKLGVSMGTNYTGHMSEEDAKKLRDATAPGAKIKWYLDAKRWQWTENRRYRAPGALRFIVLCFTLLTFILIQ